MMIGTLTTDRASDKPSKEPRKNSGLVNTDNPIALPSTIFLASPLTSPTSLKMPVDGEAKLDLSYDSYLRTLNRHYGLLQAPSLKAL